MELNISFDSYLSSYIMQTLKLTVMKFKISHIIWSINIFTQLCPTLCNPMNCSPSSSSLQGILQARILEWVVISFSRASSWPRDWNQVSFIASRFFTIWATRELSLSLSLSLYIYIYMCVYISINICSKIV